MPAPQQLQHPHLAGSGAAFAAVKLALSSASTAFDRMKNAAKQATEMAEANIAKASKTAEPSSKKK